MHIYASNDYVSTGYTLFNDFAIDAIAKTAFDDDTNYQEKTDNMYKRCLENIFDWNHTFAYISCSVVVSVTIEQRHLQGACLRYRKWRAFSTLSRRFS